MSQGRFFSDVHNVYRKVNNVVREVNRNGGEDGDDVITFVITNNGEKKTFSGSKTNGRIRIVTRNGEIVQMGEEIMYISGS